MGSHLMCNRINNLNITITPIVGNITARGMKIAMLCHTMHHCFFMEFPSQHSTHWSYYLFKYTMKCESSGPLNLNQKIAKCLGLQKMFHKCNFNSYPPL
jgi:hypothetical protein